MISLEKEADLETLLLKRQPHFAFLTDTWPDTTLENSEITNYRSISLLPEISLIFKKLLHTFPFDLLMNKSYQRQYGFQSIKDTTFQLLECVTYLYLNKGDILFSIYFDYEKAFNRVPHSVLLVKLQKNGLDSKWSGLEVTSSEDFKQY